jgi:protein gp37
LAVSSAIEWTEATWNPVTGCTKVSPGCDNCYAATFSERFRDVPGHYFENGFDLQLRPKMLTLPDRWRQPRKIFVNSMSDLFHVNVPDCYIDQVFDCVERVDRHIYQLLTKRPERMRRYMRRRYGAAAAPAHLWLGVSVENNDFAWRVDMLRSISVSVRFLSIEPMLGPVDQVNFDDIAWVIVGGESGARRRAIDPAWVRDVRDRCAGGEIPFFFKQWHKAGTGRVLDGRTWGQMPAGGQILTQPESPRRASRRGPAHRSPAA